MNDLFSRPPSGGGGGNDALPLLYPSLAGEKPEDVLRLIRTENVGSITFFRLVRLYGGVRQAIDAVPELSQRGGRKKPLVVPPASSVAEELERAKAYGAEILLYGDDNYPPLLTQIHDAPPLLTAHGNLHLLQHKMPVALVGSRNASANGCLFARRLAGDLGRSGAVTVSGLARGIDGATHQATLSTGTIGVIGGGIDTVYPQEHAELYEKMRETGVIVSEQPFGVAPQPRNFPARNRIISGIAKGVIVVEASLKSGSLITARMAAEQGRDVFAVPGAPMDPRSKGTNQLLRDGAILTESAEDVLSHLRTPGAMREPRGPNYEAPSRKPQEISDEELEKARRVLQERMGSDAVLVDELIAECLLTADAAYTVLLEMELAGMLERQPGGKVCKLIT